MSDPGFILIVFSDSSLGGTSRSACLAGAAWESLGYNVVFCAFRPIHPGRIDAFESVGNLLPDLGMVNWDDVACVHYHHGAWSPMQLDAWFELSSAVKGLDNVPPLMTNNIFAVEDSILSKWPGPRSTAVLGQWAAEQYRANSKSGARSPIVIPNPQDASFFRIPTETEKENSKLSWSVAGPCLLRIGSPHFSKWSSEYLQLIDSAASAGIQVILVGVPDELRVQIGNRSGVTVLSPLEDDTQLRSLYWAADLFSIDALRGESFGNVIFEALLCGTQVVYRARRFRDNTPWELRNVTGFSYVRSAQEWINLSLELTVANYRGRSVEVDSNAVAESYSVFAVAEMLHSELERLQGFERGSGRISRRHDGIVRPGHLDRLRIRLRHNPLVAKLKQRALLKTAL